VDGSLRQRRAWADRSIPPPASSRAGPQVRRLDEGPPRNRATPTLRRWTTRSWPR